MNNAPIGVFDSGLGGLTAVKELLKVLPEENIIYFGDTGRVPYGTRSTSTIIKYTQQDINFLLSKNVKAIVAACGTVSSAFPKELSNQLPIPFSGVIEPTVEAALRATKNERIGVVGTPATIKSNSYVKSIMAKNAGAMVVSNSCPLLVPLVENGYIDRDNFVTRSVAAEYFAPLLREGVDTIILGCTHYPVITEIIQQVVGPNIVLIDSGKETAIKTALFLKEQHLLAEAGNKPEIKYFVSDTTESFGTLATIFLGTTVTDVTKIDIESVHT